MAALRGGAFGSTSALMTGRMAGAGRGQASSVDLPSVVAGVLFVTWPLQYRRSTRRIADRMRARGADADEFERRMSSRLIRIALVIAPITGVVLIVLGLLAN
jgi:hypothetical protein